MNSSILDRTVIVEHLPLDVKEREVYFLFRATGGQKNIYLKMEGNEVTAMVVFVDRGFAELAAREFEVVFDKQTGHRITVQLMNEEQTSYASSPYTPMPHYPMPPVPMSQLPPIIWVGGIQRGENQTTLSKYIYSIGIRGLESANVLDRKGFAFLRFTTPTSAARAIRELHGHVYKGKGLRATVAVLT